MGVGISIFLEYFRSPLPLLLTLSDRPAQHCGAKAVRGAPTLHGRGQDAGRGPHPGDPGRAARRPADRGHVTPAGQSGAAGRPSAEQGLLRHNKHKQEQLGAATPSRHALPAARGPGAGRAGGANFAPRREQQAPTPALGNAAPAQRDAPRSPHGPNNSASKLGLHVGRVDAEPRGRDADPSARSPGAPPTARRARRCGGGGADETRGGGGGVPGQTVRGGPPGASVPRRACEPGGQAGRGAGKEPRGRGCCGRGGRRAARRRRADRGRRARASQRADSQASRPAARTPGPPRGAGGGRAGTPGRAQRGTGTSCLGPHPGPSPERVEAARPERESPQPPRAPSPAPAAGLTLSGGEIRGCQRLFGPQLR